MNKVIKQFAVESKAIDAEAGIYEAVISTESTDRSGDIVRASGCRHDAYMRNPVVLWAHDYYELPVARCVELQVLPGVGIRARFQFPEWGVSEKADTVRRMWTAGFLNATSIGFNPLKAAPMDNKNPWGAQDYLEWELLEFSIVPVPANGEALRLAVKTLAHSQKAGRVLSAANEAALRQAISLLESVLGQMDGGMDDEDEDDMSKAAVPFRSYGAQFEGAWSGPVLGDFTDMQFGELSAAEKRRIMNHFAWTANNPPEIYGDLKLAHHAPQMEGVGPAVWRGVVAAMAALLGARGGVDIPDADRQGIYDHLVRHYAEFDREAPELRAYTADELKSIIGDTAADIEPNTNVSLNDESEIEAELKQLSEYFKALEEVLK